MKFKNLLGDLLLEASKKDVLINKLGVNDYNAKALADVAGPLTVFFAYKILEKYEEEYFEDYKRMTKAEVAKLGVMNRMALVNGSNSFVRERDKVRGIMDWVRVGLNGNIKPYESLSFDAMYDESEKWHESLGIGESKIDYKEEHDVILDYRENGVGLYWADLGTKQCPEEAERMGHCASSRGHLYSLREFKSIPNDHTLNKSYLTASIDESGSLLQLKGSKNSKPKPDFHKYILPLFYVKKDNDEYLIESFGYEYNSNNDFKIEDLTEEQIKKLYEDRPGLFTGRKEIKLLKKMGLVDSANVKMQFTIKILPNMASDYIRGELTHIIPDILMGDTWQMWDNFEYADWRSAIQYHVDDANTQKIINMLKNSPDFNNELSLEDMIEEYDETDEIKTALRSAINDAESDDYGNHLYKELKETFSEYGIVTSMNDEGVVIDIDLDELISTNNIDDEIIDEISERCEDSKGVVDEVCMFGELISEGYIDKPRFDVDDRWYPDVDNGYFNELLNERLDEI